MEINCSSENDIQSFSQHTTTPKIVIEYNKMSIIIYLFAVKLCKKIYFTYNVKLKLIFSFNFGIYLS